MSYDGLHHHVDDPDLIPGLTCVECGGCVYRTTCRKVGVSGGDDEVWACADGCMRVMPMYRYSEADLRVAS